MLHNGDPHNLILILFLCSLINRFEYRNVIIRNVQGGDEQQHILPPQHINVNLFQQLGTMAKLSAKLQRAMVKLIYKKCAMRANRFVSRTINDWLHSILGENQGLENLHNFGRGLKKFPQLSIGLCLLCFKQKTENRL